MTISWSDARSVLAVRLDAMGDLLMTEPALNALAADGRRRVTLLTSPAAAEVAALMPSVTEVIPYAAPWMKATPERSADDDHRLIDRLRRARFDAAVIFTVYSQSPLPAALMTFLAGIPLRAAHCRENPYQLLSDWIRDPEPELLRHEVERQIALVQALGCHPGRRDMRLMLSSSLCRRTRTAVRAAGIDPAHPWLLLHPGATAPSRRYPIDRYAAAARRLMAEDGYQVLIVGGPDDRAAVNDLRARIGPGVAVAEDSMSVAELAAAIKEATVFVGNNSGPAHLAAAVQTPSVVLYALTNPQHMPWGVDAEVLSHDVPCRNCYRSICPLGHHLCLRGISADAVVDAVRRLMARVAGPPSSDVQSVAAHSPGSA